MRFGSNDPIVGRAILRALNLLATPQQLMNEPEVLTRALELAAERAAARADDGGGTGSGPDSASRSGPGRPGGRWARSGPTHQEMIDLTAA